MTMPCTMIRRTLLPLMLAGLVSACATPKFVPLDPEVEANITKSSVVVLKMQDDLGWSFRRSNMTSAAAVSGLLGALIFITIDGVTNSNRAEAAEMSSSAIRAQFDIGELDEIVRDRAPDVLAQAPWLRDLTISQAAPFDYESMRVLSSGQPAHQNEESVVRKVIDNVEGNARGVLKVFCWLNETASSIVFKAELVVYPEPGDDSSLPDPIYRASQSYDVPVDGATPNLEVNAELWTSDGGQQIRRALKNGGRRVMEMLARDIANPRRMPSS